MRRFRVCAIHTLGLLAMFMAVMGRDVASAADMTRAMPAVSPQDYRGDLRDLPLIFAPPGPYRPRPSTATPGTVGGSAAAPAALAPSAGPRAPMPSPTQNFAGLSFSDMCGGVQCGGGWPAIANGAAGQNHYIQ